MVVGKILGMAGKKLAKKFLSKKLGKEGMSTFKKRRDTLSGNPYLKSHINAFQRVPAIGKKLKKKD